MPGRAHGGSGRGRGTATFYNFKHQMVARAIPDVWSYAAPGALLEARLVAMDEAMRRVLGDDVISSSSLRRAAELAAVAVSSCDMGGRALAAANQAIPEPAEPHLRLWQALTTIREHRGDGHVIQLVNSGISPSEALVLQAATGRSPEEGLRSHRGWSDDDWMSATEALRRRGLVGGDGRITPAGTELRDQIETGTDRLAGPVTAAIGDDGTAELVSLLRPIAEVVMRAGAVPAHNNMGVPWPPPGSPISA